MNHHVGVAADWRCKVRVIVECQTVMPDVFGRIFGLCHCADSKRLNNRLFRLTIHVVKQVVHRFGNLTLRFCLQLISEPLNKQCESHKLVLVGLTVDTIDKRAFAFVVGRFPDKLSHLAVGKKHKLFNQLVRLFLFFQIDADRARLLVELEFNLLALKRNGTCCKAALAHFLSQIVKL